MHARNALSGYCPADLPHEDMRVPSGLTELPSPTETLAIEGEVFGDPQDGIRSSAELVRSERLSESSRVAAETEAALAPRVGPKELLVVVDNFSEEGPFVRSAINSLKQDMQAYNNRASHI